MFIKHEPCKIAALTCTSMSDALSSYLGGRACHIVHGHVHDLCIPLLYYWPNPISCQPFFPQSFSLSPPSSWFLSPSYLSVPAFHSLFLHLSLHSSLLCLCHCLPFAHIHVRFLSFSFSIPIYDVYCMTLSCPLGPSITVHHHCN